MKKYFFIMLLFFTAVSLAFGQQSLFRPFTSFRVIRTAHFDIIFPRESEASARLLASYADSVYEQISAILGITVPGRIPVTFAPHTDMFNGYYQLLGRHIMLFDTPPDLEWTSFPDTLKYLFIHELTHAISLRSAGEFMSFLSNTFGAWAELTFLTAPLFMVEGVTITMESLSGFGRGNDPRVRQYLRQAVHEDGFLTPLQASGLYDRPLHETWYEYGALFSAYLIQHYGMEQYAQLWQAMGSNFSLSLFVYDSDFYRIFSRVYGLDFLTVWDSFRNSFRIENLEENTNELLPPTRRFFRQEGRFIRALAAHGTSLFFIDRGIDRRENRVAVYDTVSGRTRHFTAGIYSYDLDVDPSGQTVLVSGYRFTEDRAVATVTEYHAANGRRTGRRIQGMYRARYFRDGVIGIRSDLHNTLIVFQRFSGEPEVLLRGRSGFVFSGPQAIDNDRIALIAARNGVRELWLYNYASQELRRIELSGTANNYWNHIRGLGVSDGKLFFAHNADDRMFKPAFVDLEQGQAVFGQRDFSGGVFNPVALNGNLYYLGAFFGKDTLLRFPEPAATLSGQRYTLRFTALDTQSYQPLTPTSALNTARLADSTPYDGSTRPYIALRYINPLQLWLPLPLVRNGIEGVGILSVMSDPTDRHLITMNIYADFTYRMALIETLSWQNSLLGFPVTAAVSDRVVESGNQNYRATTAELFVRLNNSVTFGGGYVRNAAQTSAHSAYDWNETTASNFFVSAALVLSVPRVSLSFAYISFIDSIFSKTPERRLDGVLAFNAPSRFPLSLSFFGAYDARGMDLHGVSNSYGSPLVTRHALQEYAHPRYLTLDWLAGADLSVTLFSLEIQRNLSHLYFSRLTGTLSLRSQIYQAQHRHDAPGLRIHGIPFADELEDLRLIQSLALRLALRVGALPLLKRPFFFEPFAFGSWNFTNTMTATGSPFTILLGLSLSF